MCIWREYKWTQFSDYKEQLFDRSLDIFYMILLPSNVNSCAVFSDFFLSYYFSFTCFTVKGKGKYLQYKL